MFTSRLCTLLLAILFVSIPISPQITGDEPIEVHSGNGSARKMILMPPAAKVLFPSSKVFLDENYASVSLPVVEDTLLRSLQFVTLSNYSTKPTPKTDLTEREENPLANTARITAVAHGDKIYLVSELFCDENVSVINALMRSVGVSVHSPAEALQVAEFFLQLGYYRFDGPGKFIASTLNDLAAKQMEFPGQDTTEIQNLIHPPVAARDGGEYKVEIVTTDRDTAFVLLHRWSIRILESQITDAHEEVLYPTYMRYRAGNKFGGTLASTASTLRFQQSFIGDGPSYSSYGFNTSDGPHVIRSSRYLTSEAEAVRELDSKLHSASQFLNEGSGPTRKEACWGIERLCCIQSKRPANLEPRSC